MSSDSRVTGQGLTIAAFLLAVLLLAGGLVFLCAAVQNPARFPLSLALLAIGAGLAAWAGWRWRRARQLAPDILDDQIVELAAVHDAELTLSRVVGDLGVPDDAARAALARLEGNGLCRPERRADKTVYIFPGLKESKVVRRCVYCGSEFSVREPLHKCPNCGGRLEIVKT